MKLREIAHSRTGDKGNTSNISVIAFEERHYPLLERHITAERVTAHFAEIAQVTRREVTHERVQAVPERVRFGASAREGFPFDEVVEDFGYLQAADRDVLHDAVLPRYPVLESHFGT